MAELLLELLSEEIPARMQARAAEDLKKLVTDRLAAAGLKFTRADAFATPRRLALVVDGLPTQQADVRDEKKGPRVGAPQPAIDGFLKSVGFASLDRCEKRDLKGAEFWFAVIEKKGGKTVDALSGLLWGSIIEISRTWPKSMRWQDFDLRWARPLQNILAIFDGAVIDFAVQRKQHTITHRTDGQSKDETYPAAILEKTKPLFANNRSLGHRFLGAAEFAVADFADYKAKLAAAKVILDPAERRAKIDAQLRSQAQSAGFVLVEDRGLLDEVTGLVEWPVVLTGTIDAKFMDVPAEVLITAMRAHQKYFSMRDAKTGALANRFLVVANMEADDGKAIVAGNERVLRARLSDAKFFWDQDRKQTLESRVPALKDVTFHAKLGTLADKMARVEVLAEELAPFIPGADRDRVRSAARLAKADLTTGLVGEFPELQGVMGRYYALHDKEHAEVADAIAEHYSPLGPNDTCPTAPVSVAVALGDKIDSLVGFFAIDERPTGSKDPYALRRAALGVIRIVLENKLRINLAPVFTAAEKQLPWKTIFNVHGDLLAFLADRLKVHLREKGVRHDLISAIFDLGGEDDLVRLLARVDALAKFLASDDGANLLVAYRRAANIVRIEEKKDRAGYDGAVDAALLQAAEERNLAAALAQVAGKSKAAVTAEDFVGAMTALAGLRAPVDAFFDKVTVNADDAKLRANRLRLLASIKATMDSIADFSKIEG
ncbi:MAG: glycine--tRNA ligase subunit beta [Alphaproteobacteria bacterium]